MKKLFLLLTFLFVGLVAAEDFNNCTTLSNPNTVYQLTQNLTNASTCINITASNITLDCQWYGITITGTTALQHGILVNTNQPTLANVTVKRCYINVTGTSTHFGIWYNATEGLMTDNIIYATASTGTIYSDYAGKYINLTVANSYISSYGATGRAITVNAENTTMVNNTIAVSGYGIYEVYAGHYENNTVYGNGDLFHIAASEFNAYLLNNTISVWSGAGLSPGASTIAINNTINVNDTGRAVYGYASNWRFIGGLINLSAAGGTGFYFPGSTGVVIQDVNIISVDGANETYSTSSANNNILLNTTINTSRIGWGDSSSNFTQKWYLDGYVQDSSLAPISGAFFNATDGTGTTQFNVTTAASGSITKQNATQTIYTQGYWYNYSNIYVGAAGYVANSSLSVFITDNALWNVTLAETSSFDAPVVSLVSPSNGSANNTEPVVFTYTAWSSAGFTNCSLWGNWSGTWALNNSNSTAIANNSNNFISVAGIPEGFYRWGIDCYDGQTPSLNTTNATYFLLIDRIAPQIIINYPVNFSTIYLPYGQEFSINGSATDANLFSIVTNHSNYTGYDMSTPFNFTNTTLIPFYNGVYSVKVTANDSAGNTNSSEVYFTLYGANYTLVNNLTLNHDVYVPNGLTGFTTETDGLLLDCAGYRIFGNGSGTGYYINGADNTHTINCFFQNFTIAVNLSYGNNSLFYNDSFYNISSSTAVSFYNYHSNYTRLYNSNFSYSRKMPYFYASSNTITQNNTLKFSNDYAVVYTAQSSLYNLFFNNTITNVSGGDALFMEGSWFSNYSYNNFTNASGLDAIFVEQSSNNTIQGNKIGHVDVWALSVSSSNNNTLSFNSIWNASIGIMLNADVNESYVFNNTISNCSTGLYVVDGRNRIFDNQFGTQGWNYLHVAIYTDAMDNYFFHNNFTNNSNYYINNTNNTNHFNQSIGGVQQGNYYEDILNYNIYDNNGDGWADAGDLPYRAVSPRWLGYSGDYAPYTTLNDTASPYLVNMTSPANNSNSTVNYEWFNIFVADNLNITSCVLQWSNGTNVTMTFTPSNASSGYCSYNQSVSSTGIYDFVVWVWDAASNYNRTTWRWTYVNGSAFSVSALTPLDGQSGANPVLFEYLPVQQLVGFANCSLFLDGVRLNTTLAPLNNTITSFEALNLSVGAYNWSVVCFDVAGNSVSSGSRGLTVQALPRYGFDTGSGGGGAGTLTPAVNASNNTSVAPTSALVSASSAALLESFIEFAHNTVSVGDYVFPAWLLLVIVFGFLGFVSMKEKYSNYQSNYEFTGWSAFFIILGVVSVITGLST